MAGKVAEGGNIVGGKRARKPGEVEPAFTLSLPVRELETSEAIGCGFQMAWGEVDVKGDKLELYSGAGLGSGWATISFRGKTYAIGAHDLVDALLEKVAPDA